MAVAALNLELTRMQPVRIGDWLLGLVTHFPVSRPKGGNAKREATSQGQKQNRCQDPDTAVELLTEHAQPRESALVNGRRDKQNGLRSEALRVPIPSTKDQICGPASRSAIIIDAQHPPARTVTATRGATLDIFARQDLGRFLAGRDASSGARRSPVIPVPITAEEPATRTPLMAPCGLGPTPSGDVDRSILRVCSAAACGSASCHVAPVEPSPRWQ
jgi:hypothetical protein